MATSVKHMMEAANAAVPRISPAEAHKLMADPNTLVVDVRDAPELKASGKVAARSTSRVACWNSAPIRTRPITIRISARTRP